MTGYKINFAANTVTVTKSFADKANRIDTEEYKTMMKLRKDFPDIEVVYKSSARSKGNSVNKGLTYANMEQYINAFDNRKDLLKAFDLIKQLSSVQRNRYQFVKSWFVAQFPNYREIPQFSLVDNVVPLNIKLMEKVVEEAEQSA